MAGKLRVGVLISGRGSNMAALVEAAAAPGYPAEIVAVVANNPDAAGLAFAASRGIATAVVDHREHRGDKEGFERRITAVLEGEGADFVCLAGFMRILSPWFIARWRDRLINIHPSLLPAYRGLDTHARALADGVRVAGCTVHAVRDEMDVGPIVAQGVVPVMPGDTPETLAARILAVEHRLYPHALALIASGAARIVGERVEVDPAVAGDGAAVLIAPPPC